MLERLSVRDFAVARSVEIEPGAGLTVFTGETGAGKSLIVDALAGGTPLKELVRAAYALHLSLRTGHGRVHSAAQIAAWTAAAGLTDTAEIDCGSQMTAIGALLSRKP